MFYVMPLFSLKESLPGCAGEAYRLSDFPYDVQFVARGGDSGTQQIRHLPLAVKRYAILCVQIGGNLLHLLRADGVHGQPRCLLHKLCLRLSGSAIFTFT